MSEYSNEQAAKKQQFFNEYVQLSISDDKLAAFLVLSKTPEVELEISDFIKFLRQQGIVFGIDEDHLQSLCEQPSDFIGKNEKVAYGTPPIHGDDAKIIWNFSIPGMSTGEASATNERIDYREIDNVTNVQKGQLLAIKQPFTEGIPGINIFGQQIDAKTGRNISFKIGKNVHLDETGSSAYAIIDGQVSITENDKINVFPVYEVKGNVDYSIGNIDFIGTVIVRGNVLAGFSVRADGDIRIFGEVEAADLEASGNIEIRAGIFGQGKGSVKAGNNLTASYLNQANVYAKNDVIVGSIMHSNVKAERKVICRRGKGLIVGGRIQAGEMIDVNVIGNDAHTLTQLEVGISPELTNEYISIKERMINTESDLDKAKKAFTVLNHQYEQLRSAFPAEKLELRNNVIKAVNTLQQILTELETRKLHIEESLELSSQARIDVHNIAFPGTKLVFGKYVRQLKLEHSRISFRLDEGEITALPL